MFLKVTALRYWTLFPLICDLTYNWFQYTLEKETAPVVFIVSTTGDGEPPDNALKFVKLIKKKTLSNDHYKHLCYALLGKFCFDRLKLLLLYLFSSLPSFAKSKLLH